MHPVHTLRRPAAPLARQRPHPARPRLGSALLWLIVLAPLAWGVHATWQDVAVFLRSF